MSPWLQAVRQVLETNPFERWILAGATPLLLFLLFLIVRSGARRRHAKAAPGTMARFVWGTLVPLRTVPALLLGIGAGMAWLSLPEGWASVGRGAFWIGLGIQLGLMLSAGLSGVVQHEVARRRARKQTGLASFGIVSLIGQVIVWSLVLLFVLDKLGVDVTALVASLGVGGIAVALAAQNILGDLFASLSIVMDRPFEVGDFIALGDDLGVVDTIGLKSTRIQALSGELLVVGNADLLRSRIRNYRSMPERRVVVRFGVLYGSKPDQLRQVPDVCRRAVERLAPRTRFDRAHLDVFAASSLEYELVYYFHSNDYAGHMEAKQAILLELFEELQKLGLEFAFPTQTVHLGSVPRELELRAHAAASSGDGLGSSPPS